MHEARRLSNVGIKGRIKQIVFLVAAIILGVIISSTVDAQDFEQMARSHNDPPASLKKEAKAFHKEKRKHFLAKYKTQIKFAYRECFMLESKRNATPRHPLFATRHRKPKYKPQAEFDAPGTNRTVIASNP